MMNTIDSAPLLEVRGLVKTFTRNGTVVKAVNDVSFTVRPGQVVAIVGESGCGKSTIARCVTRLIKPDTGTITLAGQDALTRSGLRAVRASVQLVFQDPGASLNPSMTIARMLRESVRLHHPELDRRQSDYLLPQIMELVELDRELLDRFPDQLSGGQKQRAAIGRALATSPRLIVLDEPTSALDMSLRSDLLALLGKLQRERGIAYLLITHDFSVVRQLAERVIVMYLGNIVEEGPASDVIDRPAHPYTQSLVAAIPVPDPDQPRVRSGITGEAMLEGVAARGCVFQDRCPHVMEQCRELPVPSHVVGSSTTTCFLHGNDTNLKSAWR